MAEKTIWNGSSTFSPGQTQFGFYDNDSSFAQDADRVAGFCTSRLGYPMMDVELDSGSLYTCFEEAVTTYGNEVYQFLTRQNYISLEGSDTGVDLNNTLIRPNLARIIEISKNYGTEAEVGTNIPLYKGTLEVTGGKQVYDLNEWAVNEGITGGIEIRKVFYEAPPAILRYFDPYAGTGTGIQSLMDAFDFGSYSPGVNFLLMPASYDLLKVQAIEFNDQIRRSAYSFRLNNNQLTVLPVPKQGGKLLFEYFRLDDKQSIIEHSNTPGDSVVNTVMNVPYENPVYSEINSIGRQWIYQYTLALAMQTLAYVRGKYSTVPVPGSEATLNQADLLTDSRALREELLSQLREMLDEVSTVNQLKNKAEEGESLNKVLSGVPMSIYVK